MMYWWDGTGAWWIWLIMIIFWGIIIALVIWAIIAFTKRSDGSSQSPPASRALDIARERYARGEISQEEFERIKRGIQ